MSHVNLAITGYVSGDVAIKKDLKHGTSIGLILGNSFSGSEQLLRRLRLRTLGLGLMCLMCYHDKPHSELRVETLHGF